MVRFSGIFSSSLTCEKCQPPLFYYPLEEKRLSERKSGLLSKAFLTDLSGQEKVNWPKNLKIEKKQPYHRKGSAIGLLSIEKFTIV